VRRRLLLSFLCAAASTGGAVRAAEPPADLVLRGGRVYTMTAAPSPVVNAVAVRGETIVYAGDEDGASALISGPTRVIDLRGRTVVPGFVDAHAHLYSLGKGLREPDLVGAATVGEAAARVRAFQRDVPPGAWIHGRGWDQNDWPVRSFPTWRDLEATNANPVYLDRVDGHALWLNRAALDAAGITRDTPDPPGGRIVRDDAGEPTGVLVDEAEALVEVHVPPPSPEELDQRLALAVAECNRFGLVGVHDAGTTRAVLESLRRLAARGRLTINVYCMIDTDEPGFARAMLAAGPASEAGGRLVCRALKLRADGALGSRGAALIDDYSDEKGNRGLVVDPPDSLLWWTREALRHGFQVGTHAIGDRGNRMVLDAYEAALRAEAVRGGARLRLEHGQVIAADDLDRLAPLGIIASMQPTHATSDMPWAEDRVGPARIRGAYAWRSLQARGVVLAFGSDFPVEAVDPLRGVYAAVTRQDAAGNPPGGWYAGEKLSVEEAVRAFTAGAAFAAFDEEGAGTIEAGRRADLTVLDGDIFVADARALLDTRAVLTVVRGAVVYEAR
jgi:predicted amidohydrolase YtcJ